MFNIFYKSQPFATYDITKIHVALNKFDNKM